MKLEMGVFNVTQAEFSDRTEFREGVLSINKAELLQHLSKDSPFQRVELDLVRPGEDARIVHALDIAEPRVKVSGPGQVFAGMLGPPSQAGEGRTHRLAGFSVVGAAEPFPGEDVWYAREAVIDMSGPGADYSLFSQTINLVLSFIPHHSQPSSEPEERINYEVDYKTAQAQEYTLQSRLLGLKAAGYLAEAVRNLEPPDVHIYELSPVDDHLPKVVYLVQNLGGVIYGAKGVQNNNAVLLHPNELMDGAVVNGKWWNHACMREATYLFQNEAVVSTLYSSHGKTLNFLGVIFFDGGQYKLEDKDRESSEVVKISRMLGADGAIISPLSAGHQAVGYMMICQKCESAGISTVLGIGQMTNNKGDPGFTTWVPEADAIIIPGDDEEILSLPAVKRVIGGTTIMNSSQDASGPIEIQLRSIYGATGPIAPGRLNGRLY